MQNLLVSLFFLLFSIQSTAHKMPRNAIPNYKLVVSNHLHGESNQPPSENIISVSVDVSNITQAKGSLRVGFFREGNPFTGPKAKPDVFKVVPITAATTQQAVVGLPAGRYVIAVYHDLNDNGKLDKNMVGYPKEPFGFSKNFRPILSAPSFEDCAIEIKENSPQNRQKIKLID
jgi:uncharacterized protein (DUF2141 family)